MSHNLSAEAVAMIERELGFLGDIDGRAVWFDFRVETATEEVFIEGAAWRATSAYGVLEMWVNKANSDGLLSTSPRMKLRDWSVRDKVVATVRDAWGLLKDESQKLVNIL